MINEVTRMIFYDGSMFISRKMAEISRGSKSSFVTGGVSDNSVFPCCIVIRVVSFYVAIAISFFKSCLSVVTMPCVVAESVGMRSVVPLEKEIIIHAINVDLFHLHEIGVELVETVNRT